MIELVTLADFLRYLTTVFIKEKLFFGHGTDNAWDEAVALLCSFTCLSEEELSKVLSAKLTEDEKLELIKWANLRIKDRKPLPYITNKSYFAGLEFYVDERVIIPRSPFAEIILNNFEPFIGDKNIDRVLDLCTGSGCMACATAYYNPDTIVDAVDLSDDALEIAGKNIKNLGLENQINLIKSDLFKNIKNKYDLIISNPPYVPNNSMKKLPKEYAHEPNMALESDNNGIFHAENILKNAAQFLTDDGLLFLEVGEAQQELEDKFPEVPFTWLELEHGGEGILVITKDLLEKYL